MEIKELLKMQKELDQYIIDKKYIANTDGSDIVFLNNRLLALFTEVAEFCNATRCFKYWSNKEAEPKERLLDEYADILHFLLSIGNTMGFTAEEIEQAYIKKHEENYNRQKEGY